MKYWRLFKKICHFSYFFFIFLSILTIKHVLRFENQIVVFLSNMCCSYVLSKGLAPPSLAQPATAQPSLDLAKPALLKKQDGPQARGRMNFLARVWPQVGSVPWPSPPKFKTNDSFYFESRLGQFLRARDTTSCLKKAWHGPSKMSCTMSKGRRPTLTHESFEHPLLLLR